MDTYSPTGLSATDETDNHKGFCMNTLELVPEVLEPLPADELSTDVTKFLNVQDPVEDGSTSSTPCKSMEFLKPDLCDKFLLNETVTRAPEKRLDKQATFPFSGKTASSQDEITSESSTHGDNMKPNNPSAFRSLSLPTHLKPVSAMKGSREKRGAVPSVKLTVKWAPDVYDPIPTSVSHVVSNNRSSSKHGKRNSKNKQKHGSKSSSRGSKSKDKKQVRKRSGSSSSGSGYNLDYKLEHEEQLIDFLEPEPQSGGIEFHVGNPDRLCGSSFMKRYGTSLHMSSVAEAT